MLWDRGSFGVTLARKEREEDRCLSWEEFFEFPQSRGDAYRRTALRVLVYENPYAKRRLPANIFAGPFDVRWGPLDGLPYINRLYVGLELAKLEAAEHELELDVGPLRKITEHQKTMKLPPWEAGYESRRRSAKKASEEKRSE